MSRPSSIPAALSPVARAGEVLGAAARPDQRSASLTPARWMELRRGKLTEVAYLRGCWSEIRATPRTMGLRPFASKQPRLLPSLCPSANRLPSKLPLHDTDRKPRMGQRASRQNLA
jgi:hypothetical protein